MKGPNHKKPKDFPLTWKRFNSVGFWARELKGYLETLILVGDRKELRMKQLRSTLIACKRAARFDHDSGPAANFQDDRDLAAPYVDLPEGGLTPMEYLWRNLYVLWADPNFWEELRSSTDDEEGYAKITDWIESEYRLRILFPRGLWLKLLDRKLIREYFFELMKMTSSYYVVFLTKEAEDKVKVFQRYIKDDTIDRLIPYSIAHPFEDMRNHWAWAFVELDEDLIQRLEESVKKMLNAIRWIKKNPLEIPSGCVSLPKGRPKDVGAARLREQMVQILRDQPDISDAQLAKMVAKDGKYPQRHIAADARKLAKFRDQIPVVFHSPGA